MLRKKNLEESQTQIFPEVIAELPPEVQEKIIALNSQGQLLEVKSPNP